MLFVITRTSVLIAKVLGPGSLIYGGFGHLGVPVSGPDVM